MMNGGAPEPPPDTAAYGESSPFRRAKPERQAYAEVAGLSPVNGLYARLLPTVAYVLLGSSRQLIVGPEGSISTLVVARLRTRSQEAGVTATIGRERFYPTVRAAVDAFPADLSCREDDAIAPSAQDDR